MTGQLTVCALKAEVELVREVLLDETRLVGGIRNIRLLWPLAARHASASIAILWPPGPNQLGVSIVFSYIPGRVRRIGLVLLVVKRVALLDAWRLRGLALGALNHHACGRGMLRSLHFRRVATHRPNSFDCSISN